jgi:hypothetical protein
MRPARRSWEEMAMQRKLTQLIVMAGLILAGLGQGAIAAEKQKFFFMFFSNPVKGHEQEYLKWYTGQHIHDLLNIDGIVGAQFFKLADSQFTGTHPQQYMMIWEISTDNLASAFDRVNKGLKTGTTVTSDTLDGDTANSQTFTPITNRLTSDDIKGKSPDEVRAIATKGVM